MQYDPEPAAGTLKEDVFRPSRIAMHIGYWYCLSCSPEKRVYRYMVIRWRSAPFPSTCCTTRICQRRIHHQREMCVFYYRAYTTGRAEHSETICCSRESCSDIFPIDIMISYLRQGNKLKWQLVNTKKSSPDRLCSIVMELWEPCLMDPLQCFKRTVYTYNL